MAQFPHILLIVNGRAGGGGIPDLFLGEIAKHYPSGHLSRWSLIPSGPVPAPETWLGIPVTSFAAKSSVLPGVSSLREWAFWVVGAKRTANDIRRLASQEKFDLICFVLNSPSVIHLVQPLATALDLPYIATVWDAPKYFLRNMHIDPCTAHLLQSRFRAALLGARRVSVIGVGMRAEYRRSIGIEGVLLNHGIAPELWRPQRTACREPGKLTLGFAGSLYAKREWNALIAALSASRGMIAGRRVVIRFVGRKPRLGVADADLVQHLGILPLERTIEVLSGVDLCYLPYWFSTSRRVAARLSFPSKLSGYVASGGAVFIHAPAYASPTLFHEEYPVGICRASLDSRDIIAALERFVEDESLRQRAAAARITAPEQELGLPVMLKRFAQFVGIDFGALDVTVRASNDDEGVRRLDSQSSRFFGDRHPAPRGR
jgi:hypothetical protein